MLVIHGWVTGGCFRICRTIKKHDIIACLINIGFDLIYKAGF